MNSFLQQVTTELYTRHSNDLSQCILIFPNRRSGLFFSKYLNELTNRPIWEPQIYTIRDFFKKMSNLHIEDKLGLLFRLYRIYIDQVKFDESFEDFQPWGEMLLSDFNDLDNNRVHAKHLFRNLAEEKEINQLFAYLSKEQIDAIRHFWSSFDSQKYSRHQKEFINLWEKLFDIYTTFKQKLKAEKLAYEGMATRLFIEDLESGKKKLPQAKKIILIGFNALSRCEHDFFEHLKSNGLGEFYWDYDEFYLQDTCQEAGLFLRNNLKKFPMPKSNLNFSNIKPRNANIQLISVNSGVGQAKYVHRLLQESCKKENTTPEETAIVLADEELLLPVLHSIPKEIENINITMGYPAKHTPIASLFRLIFDLRKNAEKNQQGEWEFHHQKALALLNHPYVNFVDTEAIQQLVQNIVRNNRIKLAQSFLKGNQLVEKIFAPIEEPGKLTPHLLDVLQIIYRELQQHNTEQSLAIQIEKEYIYHLYLLINRLQSLLVQHKMQLTQNSLFKILDRMIQSLNIPFEGEPLSGLQVMGILETRLLDFKTIIVLSVNEGKFPKSENMSSFIPFHLRKGFQMPNIEHQDAIFAYYFYHLIQRASHVKLLYNNQSNGAETGEMSRFLYQLKYNATFKISERTPNFNISLQEAKPICIEKNERIVNLLSAYYTNQEKYLSPSALNTYLNCSLSFYFRYLARLKEPDSIQEEISPQIFGNLFHNTLEKLYHAFVGKTLQEEDFVSFRKNNKLIEQKLNASFQNEYFKGNNGDSFQILGRNLLVFDILKKYIQQVLIIDQKFTPFEIVSLEKTYKAQIPISNNRKVNLGGSIDRVDRVNGQIRILDYKTGKANLYFKDIESLFDKENKMRNKAALQTFMYCLFYEEESKTNETILPGIYSLKSFFQNDFPCMLAKKEGRNSPEVINDYRTYKQELMSRLKEVLEEIFNSDFPFSQTENRDTCRTCLYAEICHR